MPSTKDKKSKNKILKIGVSSDSDSDGSEHELSYYAKDKVKLMKEVLKLIKPKKIKCMAPDCIKNLDIVEINSMLLEELLGISNKRLQYIFNGENVDRETSSSESEEEKQPVDVISLDDISDDDDIELCVNENEKRSLEPELSQKNKKLKLCKIKTESVEATGKLIKREKCGKESKKKPAILSEPKNKDEDLKETDKDKLMSVLELLELQARARAIRSQLAIETEKKKETESLQNVDIKEEEESDSDAIIIESPQHKEIVITSSDSEAESNSKILKKCHNRDSATSSKLSQLYNDEQIANSNSAQPQKKHKPCIAQDGNFYKATKKLSRQEDKIVNTSKDSEIRIIDKMHTKNAETDHRNRKNKLLAKIQKIKLVRNKNTSLNMELNNPNEKANKSFDDVSSIEASVAATEATSDVNQGNQETLTQNIAGNSEAELNNSINSCVPEEKILCNIIKNVKSEDSDRKLKDLPKASHKKVNVSYCDNDEIVINLDEDEMDGIEND